MYFRVELLKIEQNIQANDAIKLFILIKLTFINKKKQPVQSDIKFQITKIDLF